MQVPSKILGKWKKLRSYGDASKLMARLPGYSDESFYRVFRVGKCNDEIFKVMAEFYDEKEALIKQYL